MRKMLKIVVWIIVLLVALPLAGLLLSPLWLGQTAGVVANMVVPKFTGTDFHVEKIRINPYTGTLRVEKLRLANPRGYEAEDAAKIDLLQVKVEPLSVLSSVIRVNDITIENPYVSYLKHDGTNNFDRILANVNGEAKEELKEEIEETGEKLKEKQAAKPDAKPASADEDDDDLKVIIDRFSVSGIRVRYEMLTLPIPSIKLSGIGASKGGITFENAGLEILDAVKRGLMSTGGAIGEGLKALGAGTNDLLKNMTDGSAVKNVGKDINKAAAKVGEGAEKAVTAVSDGAAKTVTTVGDGATKAVTAVGDSATKAATAVGDGAAKAATAVGDGAKKATDAIRNIFK